MARNQIENIDIQLLLKEFLYCYLVYSGFTKKYGEVNIIGYRTLDATYDDYATNVDTRSPFLIRLYPGQTTFDRLGIEVWEWRVSPVTVQVFSGQGEFSASALEGYVRRFFKDWDEKVIFNNFGGRRDLWNSLSDVNVTGTGDNTFLLYVKTRLIEYLRSGISELSVLMDKYGASTYEDASYEIVNDFIQRVQRVNIVSEDVPNKESVQDKFWVREMDVEIEQYARIKQSTESL